tara:strand:+ start:782 stop:1246 length:465 start_codon:yes stop_codon:yes gene_type:complete
MRFFDELMTVLILAVALWLAVLCCGCNKATLYPTVGAGLGAGAGSLAGPGGSIVGGMVGQAGGELFKNDEIKKSNFDEGELYELMQMMEKQNSEQKGWVDTVISGIYEVLMLCAVGFFVFLIAPFLYTRFKVRKLIDDIFDKDENLAAIQRRGK